MARRRVASDSICPDKFFLLAAPSTGDEQLEAAKEEVWISALMARRGALFDLRGGVGCRRGGFSVVGVSGSSRSSVGR